MPPTGGSSWWSSDPSRRRRPPASTALPAGGGPTAKGSDGLPFDENGYPRLRLRAEKAVDEGNWLRVDLSLTSEAPRGEGPANISLYDKLRTHIASQHDAAGVGVLDGGVLFLPAVERTDHLRQLEWPAVDPNGLCACSDVSFHSIVASGQLRFSIWVAALPKLGATVDVQLPYAQGRLLDVPVPPK